MLLVVWGVADNVGTVAKPAVVVLDEGPVAGPVVIKDAGAIRGDHSGSLHLQHQHDLGNHNVLYCCCH